MCIASDARFYWLAKGRAADATEGCRSAQNANGAGQACCAADDSVSGTLGRNANPGDALGIQEKLSTNVGAPVYSTASQTSLQLALENEKLVAEVLLLENERARIAADLHDELGALVSAVKLNLQCLDSVTEQDAILFENEQDETARLFRGHSAEAREDRFQKREKQQRDERGAQSQQDSVPPAENARALPAAVRGDEPAGDAGDDGDPRESAVSVGCDFVWVKVAEPAGHQFSAHVPKRAGADEG